MHHTKYTLLEQQSFIQVGFCGLTPGSHTISQIRSVSDRYIYFATYIKESSEAMIFAVVNAIFTIA